MKFNYLIFTVEYSYQILSYKLLCIQRRNMFTIHYLRLITLMNISEKESLTKIENLTDPLPCICDQIRIIFFWR